MFVRFPYPTAALAVLGLILGGAGPAALWAADAPKDAAVRAVGSDGKPLNLGFEDGTLKDWTPQGKAFDGQPIKGDTVSPRRGDQRSNHAGNFWVGGFEKLGDDARGTLTSVPFKVTHRWASFLVAGGPWPSTRVELVKRDTGKVFFKVSGYENETLRPVVVDLKDYVGQEIQVRVVDDQEGHWGHVNFDDFVFYEDKPVYLKDVLDPKLVQTAAEPDAVAHAGLKPEEAAGAMTLPAGFKATLFAAEPDVVQPIAFTIDPRGRLWVVEALSYPRPQPEGQGKDRIIILEDADGDGRHDKRTVFAEGLNLVSGIEVGFGGVWVGAAPYLMFIPDRNADDKPDAGPEILLDGWGFQDTHETLNTFTWGPDGWLYGCHGVFTYSNVGKPGTPDDRRTPINAGIWRYHPTKQVFEVFAEGTSNPWGIDFDDRGQLFAEACVIPHLWHIIQGARYERQAGQHFNPFVFADIKQSADHVHYAGNGRSDAAGGGHAHAGLMVYLGDNWPDEYRGQIFIGNIHGQRINVDVPERAGSGFVARHGKDFLNFNDRWSQVINFRYGPDGGVYFIDWYDDQQCHNNDPAAHDRKNGRIYKVVYKQTKPQKGGDLARLGDVELAELQLHKNDWFVRTARRILQERATTATADKKDTAADEALGRILSETKDVTRKLRALWALHARGIFDERLGLSLLQGDRDEYVKAWSIQFLAEAGTPSQAVLAQFAKLAKEDESPVVRLYLASALQRLPLEQRWDVLAGLLSHEQADADDHNLPLMYWYALEPLVGKEPQRALKMVAASKVPNLRSFTARRIAAGAKASAK